MGLLLVFASQKIINNVQDGMAGFAVPLRKKMKGKVSRLYPPNEGSLAGCGLQ